MITHGPIRWARPALNPTVDETAPLNTAQPTNAWPINREAIMPDGSRIGSDTCIGTHRCDGATGTWLQHHLSAHLVPVQLVEAGILLALTLLVLTAAFLRIRR
ncbi:hypothetical protein ACFV1W_15890 [Kitasatospora sp. NPDC059648]|uniref:hypothetical protein n=1 Tax=Kitasatospora sp. NPDC059648 TaxID=3346894 RepID=UPI0036CEDBBA